MPEEEEEEHTQLCPSSQEKMGVSELPLEPQKLVAVVLFLVVAGFSNWIALAYIHDFVGTDPLPDVVFSLIPEQPWALGVGDLMVTFCALALIALFVLHKQRVVLIRRTLFILGILYALRTVCMLLTQLPSGYASNEEKCRRQLNSSERTFSVYARRVLEQTVHVGFQFDYQKSTLPSEHPQFYWVVPKRAKVKVAKDLPEDIKRFMIEELYCIGWNEEKKLRIDIEARMLCGDLLYSGHTLIMVVCWLTIHHYLPASIKWLHYIVKMFMVLGMACMVMSRTHYSVDVLFAYCFSVGVFTIYHAFCEIDTYRERKNSILQEMRIMKIVSWLEENVIPGKIENKLEVPFGQKIYRNILDPSHRSRPQDKSMSNSSSTAVMEPGVV